MNNSKKAFDEFMKKLCAPGKVCIIAGPCAVEGENYIEIAKKLKEIGVDALRGGTFKPRSSPYVWQGMGEEGIKFLKKAKEITGLPIISEAMNASQIKMLYNVVDIFQVGSRNMQSSETLKFFGKQDKPVLLKRGMGSTIEELVKAAEFIRNEGNKKVILCERGIRTFEPYTRNTFDINCIPAVKSISELPIVADPSHGTGRRELVIPITLGAIAAGADGILIEVHNNPNSSKTDGPQSINLEMFRKGMIEIRKIIKLVESIYGN